jgi:hypothetical protein
MAVAAVTELAEVVEATIKKGRGYQIYIALSMTGSESVMLSLANKPSPPGDGSGKKNGRFNKLIFNELQGSQYDYYKGLSVGRENTKKARLVIYNIVLVVILVRNSNSIPWI